MPTLELISGKKTVCGSNIGSCIEIKEMLSFAALHNIGAQVEVMKMKDCNMALDKIRKNNAYYRMVLTNKL